MRILVIGAKGQVGSEICALARLRKHHVIEAGRGTLLIPEIGNSSYAIEQAIKESKPDVVFNCAAEHRLAECEKRVSWAYAMNAFPQIDLVKYCSSVGAKLVYLSTDYVFPGNDGEYKEVDPPRPMNVYGLTKQLGERIVLGYDGGYVARLSHVYGHTPCKSKGPNIVDRMVSSLVNNGKIEVNSMEKAISMTYSKDAARMLLGVVGLPPGIYHCVNKGSTSPKILAEDICDLLGTQRSAVLQVEPTEEDLGLPRPANVTLLSSVVLDGLNRPILDALREYLADCGHCSPF